MWHDNETTRDLIGFQRFAGTITSLATNESLLPVTIGLFGDWGSGKSSVLRMVENNLSERDDILTLRFDGWLFEGYDDAKAALMATILDHIEGSIREEETVWERSKNLVHSLRQRINWFRTLGLATRGVLTLTSPVGIAALTGLSLAQVIEFLGDRVEDPQALEDELRKYVKSEPSNDKGLHKSIREFRSEFEALIRQAEVGTLVVLIDDLDRCLPESIVSTLEAIKLFLAVPGSAFAIAADERIVRQAIAQRYPPDRYQELDLAQEYLDKLVQIPCVLPPMDEIETETYIYLLFAEQLLSEEGRNQLLSVVRENRRNSVLSQPLNYGIAKTCLGEEASKLEADFALAERVAPILVRNLGGNPRLVKRFLNTFSLRIILSEAEGIELDQGTLAKLMVLERFHEDRFEELYLWQLEQQGVPEQIRELEGRLNESDEATETRDEPYADIWLGDPDLRAWLQMEPLLVGVDLGPYFHLARESLKIRTVGSRRLSQQQQELFASLKSGSRAAREKAAKRLAVKAADEVFSVYDVLWSQVQASPRKSAALEGLLQLAYQHEGSAKRLLEDLRKLSPANIEGKTAPRVGQIKQSHPRLEGEVNKLIDTWSRSTNKGLAQAAKAVREGSK